jgi:hypothetical protein
MMADDHGLQGSQYWKKRAEESRARVDEMPDSEARVLMRRIARMYDLLAVYAAAREARESEPD